MGHLEVLQDAIDGMLVGHYWWCCIYMALISRVQLPRAGEIGLVLEDEANVTLEMTV